MKTKGKGRTSPNASWAARQWTAKARAELRCKLNSGKQDDYWICVIGPIPRDRVPSGGDGPPRGAAEKAVCEMIPVKHRYKMRVFSGWGNSEMVAATVECCVTASAVYREQRK